jgi:carbon monoxide dehydrogenase subunit G
VRLEHQFTVPAPIDVVWPALMEPERVAPCMPGATLTGVDGQTFTGNVKVKLGPVTLLYKGSGEFAETDEQAHRTVIKASGKDTRGNGTASATVSVQLSEAGESTNVAVETDLSVTGRPAQFGRGLISEVSGRIIGEFASCLGTRLASEQAGNEQEEAVVQEGGATAQEDVPAQAAPEKPPQHLRAVPPRPEAEPIDLLGTAGLPVLKRVAPLALALAVLLIVVRYWRNR